ncbi:GNAT family N-acetyltransferase [Carboxylicivirga sp. A043]|uniref:GNAT family N-acetyltransferase n=1 Tax=Carboxylicivirga litoralis TaxID=2816963 RepID=UPI0021CB1E3D|nr:GNAT family N-acetyltransferase [Carboxylicivirga sp. A043]MCU4156638.1 GNAT family N-acetyltransferase [Carboxylicivirga sp. A043]
MITATSQDIPTIIKILAPAFVNNRSVNRCVKQDGKRLQRIENQIAYVSRISIRNQQAFLNSDKTGAVLCSQSNRKKASIWDDLFYVFKVSGLRMGFQLMKREKLIKQFHPQIPYCHLWFIGVDASLQGQGIGSKLLAEIMGLCNKQKLPIYLETSTLANLHFYNRSGFELYKQIKLPMDDFDLYFFRWMPV